MPFNINTFKSDIAGNGILQSNKYQVYITPPAILSGLQISGNDNSSLNTTEMGQRLLMRSDMVTVPSISLACSDVNRFGYGISRKMPYNALFNIVNATFICDKQSFIWQFWYMWLKSIVNFAGIDSGSGTIFNSSGNYSVKYKDDYSTIISVIVYDNFGNKVQTNNYTEAFPMGMNDVTLSWNMDNQLVKLTVAIAFTEYTIAGATLGGVNNN